MGGNDGLHGRTCHAQELVGCCSSRRPGRGGETLGEWICPADGVEGSMPLSHTRWPCELGTVANTSPAGSGWTHGRICGRNRRYYPAAGRREASAGGQGGDRKSTRLNSSHSQRSYAAFCLK